MEFKDKYQNISSIFPISNIFYFNLGEEKLSIAIPKDIERLGTLFIDQNQFE